MERIMKVLKFGGTSVGTAERMKHVARLITDGQQKIVVLSAMAGTTNSLVQIADYAKRGNQAAAADVLNMLVTKYQGEIESLYTGKETKQHAWELLKHEFDHLRQLYMQPFSAVVEKQIVGTGELLSTQMVTLYLQEMGVQADLMPALNYMRIDENGEPDMQQITTLLKDEWDKYSKNEIVITQGFICRNQHGEMDNLKRGGSDYTASLVGAAIDADEIQIWTDIDGMHNNDPRYVDGTHPVPQLNFAEAAELAYFGAKILHPTCVLPAKLKNIPVRLLNTMDPTAEGTTISNAPKPGKIEAVAAKDGICAIRIHSGRMLLAYGFLCRVFEVFERYRTSIDLITTSEVAVSLTIDDLSHLDDIVNELKNFGTVTIEKDMAIISVVGDLKSQNVGYESQVVSALKEIPVRMISYGGSDHNISILIKAQDKINALRALSDNLFN